VADETDDPTTPARAFPPPWTVAERTGSFCVEDADGLAVAWTYFSDDADQRAASGLMSRAEAQRIAKAVAMVPEMRTISRSLLVGRAAAAAAAPQD
jgi:hypothetical protein